ncbi:MAG TPA: TolC family protein [Candidatus Udaeobacter sp.]|jgi:outer membrane protein TolC|nr:TolC family protein [Candidatus Udaeobacter sp.]
MKIRFRAAPAFRLAVSLALSLLIPGGASPAGAATLRLSLADAVGLASRQAPAATLAGLDLRAAEARRAEARSTLFPSISGAASEANRTFNSRTLGLEFPSIPGQPPFPALVGPFDVADARLRASETLFDPAGWARLHAAGLGVESSRAARSAGDENAAQAAAIAYLGALRATALLEARKSDESLAASLVDLAESQWKAGVAPKIDVTRAQTQLSAARFAVIQTRNQADRAGIELARALGADPTQRFELADSLSESLGRSSAPDEATAAVAFAAAHRPDLAAADAEVRRTRAERSATRAERLPRIDAAGDWGLSGQSFGDAITTREVSLAVTVPILDGFRREGRIAEQTALLDQATVRAGDLKSRVSAEIEEALLDLGSAHEQVALGRDRVRLAEEEVNEARDRFKSGVAGNIEVINAQSSLDQARAADIDARYAMALARIALARAAGVMQSVK